MTRIRHDVNYMSDIDALVTEWYCWLNNALRSGDTISNRHPALGHRGRINLRPSSSQRSRAITAPTRFFFLFFFLSPPTQKKKSAVGQCSGGFYMLFLLPRIKIQNTAGFVVS